MNNPTGNIVGSILQLQAQRLTTIDQRTQAMSEQIDKLEEHMRQLSKLQIQTHNSVQNRSN